MTLGLGCGTLGRRRTIGDAAGSVGLVFSPCYTRGLGFLICVRALLVAVGRTEDSSFVSVSAGWRRLKERKN